MATRQHVSSHGPQSPRRSVARDENSTAHTSCMHPPPAPSLLSQPHRAVATGGRCKWWWWWSVTDAAQPMKAAAARLDLCPRRATGLQIAPRGLC